MKPKIATTRALSAYLAIRSLKFVTIVATVIFVVLIAIIWMLAYYFSPWWWIFALPIVFLGFVFLVLRFIVSRIIGLIHRHPFTIEQRESLETFTSKITNIVEARATPLPIYAIVTIKDVIFHKDARTVRKLVDDTSSLKSDFSKLERHFGEQ